MSPRQAAQQQTPRKRGGSAAHRPGPASGSTLGPGSGPGAAFLLSQLGGHAAAAFGRSLGRLDLRPPQAGFLRCVAANPGISQQEMAQLLGTPASRLVALIDELEDRDLVQRQRNPADRRQSALYLTAAGEKTLHDIGEVSRSHDDVICAALNSQEREQLRGLLGRIAAQQGLTPGVHPGYRRI